jgi:hypothetical protein
MQPAAVGDGALWYAAFPGTLCTFAVACQEYQTVKVRVESVNLHDLSWLNGLCVGDRGRGNRRF